jgi:hypothetical protein
LAEQLKDAKLVAQRDVLRLQRGSGRKNLHRAISSGSLEC